MKISRTINPSDVRLMYFGTKDVLDKLEEKEARESKLHRAVMLNNVERIPVSIYLRLPNGETVETQSDHVDYIGDNLIIKGIHTIPVSAIVDVVS